MIMMDRSSEGSRDYLAKDCKAFYEKRLQLTRSVKNKWCLEEHADSSDPSKNNAQFSKLPGQIAQLQSELLSLAHMDNELFKNLLALNDKLEELKVQRGLASNASSHDEEEEENPELVTTDEYDDEDIDEVADEDDEAYNVYTSLPPSQILERAAALEDSSSSSESNNCTSSNGGLEVMGGLKFMLRSRSFLLRPPFHKKTSFPTLNTRTTPCRSRITSPDSPFRTFDRIQENRVADDLGQHKWRSEKRSQSAERRKLKKKDLSKLEPGSSATLTRGFHLPHSSKSLWQRVFVGSMANGSSSTSFNNNGPESLPCSWSVADSLSIEDKSPSPTLKHIKQNSFDSGIHTSDSSEYSIKI